MTSEKQIRAARTNGKLGGRPATGRTPRLPITFPVEWLDRLDQQIANPRDRGRWIMEHLEPILHEYEQQASR